jgi:hypothetical protein
VSLDSPQILSPDSLPAVLAYNLLVLWKNLKTLQTPQEPMQIPEEVPS